MRPTNVTHSGNAALPIPLGILRECGLTPQTLEAKIVHDQFMKLYASALDGVSNAQSAV